MSFETHRLSAPRIAPFSCKPIHSHQSKRLMLEALARVKSLIGNTPVQNLDLPHVDSFAKLEYTNFSGSVKDRAAYHIIHEAVKQKKVNSTTTIVESSSGNFAIALMSICQLLGLKFIPVIDPNINADYEKILRLGCEVEKVSQLDATGGYLLTRIERVKKICQNDPNVFWTDQYSNENNYLSYYHTLGREICDEFQDLDYIFLGVSSGGTISGVSRRVKEVFPNIKIVAVDIEGSVIFNCPPKKRFISGIGASRVPEILKYALIDDVVHLSHADIIKGCHELFKEQMIFAGASSGACYHAVKNYQKYRPVSGRKPKALFICPDKGNAYLNTIYDEQWASRFEVECRVLTQLI